MSTLFLAVSLLCLSSAHAAERVCGPQAQTKNGTYVGRHIPNFGQDAFLGMHYALSTDGQRRFARPHYLNETWDGVKSARDYTSACLQDNPPNVFANDTTEDCLSINVIRPAGIETDAKLPVLVWIHGGGFDGGGSSDPQYNMSGIVKLSQNMEKPMIGVSFNYRLNKFGFLQSPALVNEGSSNVGMHDQRLALMWIQENIEAFGGDHKRITIWGESAGAQAVGYHLFVHQGKDEGLFHAAIMESGGPVGAPMQPLSWYAGFVESLAQTVGCYKEATSKDPADVIKCFRKIPTEAWIATRTTSLVWNPMVDGDLWYDYPSMLAEQGKFVKVPVIVGANSDEGCNFATQGLNTEDELRRNLLSYRRYHMRPPLIDRLLELYPDDPTTNPPYYLNPNPVQFPQKGAVWRRAAAIMGDIVMIAGRRKAAEQYTESGQPVYSYRFDTLAYGAAKDGGVTHFQNVRYSFQNISGNLGPSPEYDSHRRLSEDIGRAYVSFVHDHDPNSSRGNGSTLPNWPKYDLQQPKNMVLNESRSWVEDDTYRKEGMAFINEVGSSIQILA